MPFPTIPREATLQMHIDWLRSKAQHFPALRERVEAIEPGILELKPPGRFTRERQRKEIAVQALLLGLAEELQNLGDPCGQEIARIMDDIMVPLF